MRARARILLGSLFFLMTATECLSAEYSPGSDLTSLTQTAVNSLIDTIGFGLDHRAFMPASPLKEAPGVDLGLEVIALPRPQAFVDAMKEAGVTATLPKVFYFPRINVHKGLPLGFEIGGSYIGSGGNEIVGMDLKWAFLRGSNFLPSVALRGSRSWVNVFFMKARTQKLDLVISKRIARVVEPYIGGGVQWVKGDLDVPIGGATGLRVQGSRTRHDYHLYAGLPFRLLFARMTFEYDYSFIELATYGVKFGVAF